MADAPGEAAAPPPVPPALPDSAQAVTSGLRRYFGLGLVGVTGAVVTGLVVVGLPFMVVPWLPRKVFGALPYLPTSQRRINAMLDQIPESVRAPGKRFIDLGSGDGEAVLVAARRGMVAHGVELNLSLVALSKYRAWREGLSDRATFQLGNLLDHNVGDYSVIFVFGVVPLMPKIAAKLTSETRPDAWVCCHKFPLLASGWPHCHVDTLDDVHIYDRSKMKLR